MRESCGAGVRWTDEPSLPSSAAQTPSNEKSANEPAGGTEYSHQPLSMDPNVTKGLSRLDRPRFPDSYTIPRRLYTPGGY